MPITFLTKKNQNSNQNLENGNSQSGNNSGSEKVDKSLEARKVEIQNSEINSQINSAKNNSKSAGEPNAVHQVKFHLSSIVDKGIYVIAALGPLSAFDQVWQIWAIGNKSGVSLVMWLSWIPGAIFWLIYGLLHRDKPIILTQSLWLIMQVAIVSGLFWKT